MKLVADPTDARIQVKAKTSALPGLTLPLTAPVVVQLVGSDTSECQEAIFESGDIRNNADSKFSATN
jgi:hypothetical protein